MAGLAVNVDHVATLRRARENVSYPDPVYAAVLAELAGADGIVVHLREDRRHIQDNDVKILRNIIQTKLILEMAATSEMVEIALGIKPDVVTLVPEKRSELTTEGGLNLLVNANAVSESVATLQNAGIPVSIFIDPEPEQIKLAHKINAAMVEIHTGSFVEAKTKKQQEKVLSDIRSCAMLANKLKMTVNAGHGLCYQSIKAFKGIAEISEFSIGHSIIARAVMVGMERAVKDMIALIKDL
ncbi:pyridoxine 5'-phosphate synthase [Desulfobacterium sp. N47]|uniref:Pyridoxine 5'-phosphate synthase n=1 Tax=uncultured Desulfobacterium sp. TaxID=201089 RepID=E1Y9H3_9BACT|nr:Pyridoxine 5'-phosphate synthase [uncultured Desulfobacterium sp.]